MPENTNTIASLSVQYQDAIVPLSKSIISGNITSCSLLDMTLYFVNVAPECITSTLFTKLLHYLNPRGTTIIPLSYECITYNLNISLFEFFTNNGVIFE